MRFCSPSLSPSAFQPTALLAHVSSSTTSFWQLRTPLFPLLPSDYSVRASYSSFLSFIAVTAFFSFRWIDVELLLPNSNIFSPFQSIDYPFPCWKTQLLQIFIWGSVSTAQPPPRIFDIRSSFCLFYPDKPPEPSPSLMIQLLNWKVPAPIDRFSHVLSRVLEESMPIFHLWSLVHWELTIFSLRIHA